MRRGDPDTRSVEEGVDPEGSGEGVKQRGKCTRYVEAAGR